VNKRSAKVLDQEEYYFKGVEYDSEAALVDQRSLEACPSVCNKRVDVIGTMM
jgi:hypothetical protein